MLTVVGIFPRIDQADTRCGKVTDIPRNHRKAMDQAGRSDQRIPLAPRIRHVQASTLLSDGKINRQDSTFELSQDLPLQPAAQDCTL